MPVLSSFVIFYQNVAIELMVECNNIARSQCENLIRENQNIALTSAASSLERLKSGLEDYVLKHGNSLNDICQSCFSSRANQGATVASLLGNVFIMSLEVGSGVACCTESLRSTGKVMEAVIIISELSKPTSPSCIRACGAKTEVLYFKDFSPCSISQSSMNGLTSIDWKSYGLTLRSIVDQEGYALLEWENLPPCTHIDIVLHCYDKQVMMPSTVRKNRLDQTLTRKAVKLALNDLKEKNEGALLSARALKICNYAPDLATTIARLILTSNDSNFQGECHSLLGLQPQEIEGNIIEECIKGKIISAIEINDRKPQRSREAAPSLFEDDYYFQEPDVLDDEYVEGEEAFSYLDL
ncbi:hypothetical protein U1Q18_042413 [Sarracenia purpurea var. burkii]